MSPPCARWHSRCAVGYGIERNFRMKLFRLFYLLAIFGLILPTMRLSPVNISYSDLFILCALIVWLWNYFRTQGATVWAIPMHVLWLPAFPILMGGLISSFRAVNPTTSVEITIKTVFVITVWISMSMVMVLQGDLKLTLGVFLAAVSTSSLIAIVDRLANTSIGNALSGNTILFYNRSLGTFGHPNELGFVTSVGLPLALGWLLQEWGARRRLWIVGLLVATLGLFGLALFYSGSVAGWVSALASLSLFGLIWLRHATPIQWLGIAFLTLLVVGGAIFWVSDADRQANLQFLLDFNLNRAENITGPGRTQLVGTALELIAQDPFIGGGMDQTGTGNLEQDQLLASDYIHNTIIGGWLGGGLLVFLGLVACYLVVLVTALRALWWGYQNTDWVIIGLGACAVGWILFDQTQPNLYHRYTWLTLAWMFGLGLQIRVFGSPGGQNQASAIQARHSPQNA